MKSGRTAFLLISFFLAVSSARAQQTEFGVAAAERFAKLALACVHQEYPNKIAHVLASDADAKPPRELTPSFYGCYDWHSAVHGHWLLARLARTYPNAPFADAARAALAKSITRENIATEVAYYNTKGRASFERPYGLAWLLQLAAELHEWDDPLADQLSATLEPLERAAVDRISSWLPKLTYPVRTGEHSQTAFALGLMLDYASSRGNREFEALLQSRIRDYYLRDRDCPIAYEPGGEDFLSPCIAEADAVRRVLAPREFATWLAGFLPSLDKRSETLWMRPAVASDRTDGKLAHLDGLNLSRAWMLEGIASGLPENDRRRATLMTTADAHREAGVASVTGEHYEGGHWLGSFATYLVTQRGISERRVMKVKK